jgi:hypothetical protein
MIASCRYERGDYGKNDCSRAHHDATVNETARESIIAHEL